jgi:hypothetical protein
MRTFTHIFDPLAADPVGPSASLSVAEVSDAGVMEVFQTPGAGLGSWAVLDALLAPTGPNTPFVFREQLGQSREVKVALSGLFGRFVARAYLTKYLNLSLFAHVGRPLIKLDNANSAYVVAKSKGDLPDWVASGAQLSNLTVAEAKGSHDRPGPEAALNRAWQQAARIDLVIGGKRADLKRCAVVTRWGFALGAPKEPVIAVRDPDEPGDGVTSDEQDILAVGVARHHVANLLRSLGHAEIASALKGATEARASQRVEQQKVRALEVLAATHGRRIEGGTAVPEDDLIGGIVTRAGPALPDLSPPDIEGLARLEFAPTFIGVERRFVRAVIDGHALAIREALAGSERRAEVDVRSDGAASWLIRLGGDVRIA